MGMNRLLGRSS